ncbi:lipid-A-disaccharide synthase [Rubrivivax gelatinosus]|uniref:Lipid-A-disaccharide synthase n=1 Tax=Rubrivivax gelatinosus TaxID=28068 RepID=A0A4R2MDQ5_RUBGE|nr:lipid-A-disaccharide synthase [Rubrivivax gelatinosus]MBK1688608.1 lipid-A-disaccharide synthase [Rubrivivax gelatinosus]TCP04511.1 lipid-A-disaccharide synthase [Rubrivivax gelatinosus]
MRLAMVAGEASGDLLAGLLLGGLRERWPALAAAGIGGPKMAAQGFEAWWPSDRLAVHGYADALRHYREIKGIRDRLGERLLAEPPAVFVGVDAPDFNLGLEKRLKAAGIPSVHFVCPSIWAWRGGRAKKMAASCDHVLCLFPFEPELLQRHGVAATYVGHPLADAIPVEPPRAAARAALGLGEGEPVVALLPGSRRGEIEHIAPAFLQAAARMHHQRPELRFLLPVAPGLRSMVEPLVAAHAGDAPVQLLDGRSHEVLAACDVTLIASGTATLEAALFKRPMVIGYRMAWLSWQLMRRMGYLPWVGLPNILERDFVVPELLQDRCEPEALARETLAWLADEARVRALQARFVDLHHLLKRDTARRATDALAQVLESRS